MLSARRCFASRGSWVRVPSSPLLSLPTRSQGFAIGRSHSLNGTDMHRTLGSSHTAGPSRPGVALTERVRLHLGPQIAVRHGRGSGAPARDERLATLRGVLD